MMTLHADIAVVTELKVVLWKRYGQHRLYVNTTSGNRVGWFDMNRNVAVLEREDLRSEFEHVLRANGIGLPSTTNGAPNHRSRRPVTIDSEHPSVTSSPLAVPEFVAPNHQPSVSSTAKALTPSALITTPPGSPEFPWVDLAQNRPGQAVREQATILREAAPIRTFAARITGFHTDERAFRLGADGEEKVAQRLAGLPAGWEVLHSVPIGSRGSDIDHVIAGPAGVFTVNTKHHPDANIWVGGETFKVDGRNQPYVRKARFEAERASKMLTFACGIPVSVKAVIAVVGARGGLTIKAQPADGVVHVVGRKKLSGWLLSHGPIYSSDQVSIVFNQARRSTTWR
jgi:hypothetical protein